MSNKKKNKAKNSWMSSPEKCSDLKMKRTMYFTNTTRYKLKRELRNNLY